MHNLDAIVFTYTHTYIHYRGNSINEFARPQNVLKRQNLKITILFLHIVYVWNVKKERREKNQIIFVYLCVPFNGGWESYV